MKHFKRFTPLNKRVIDTCSISLYAAFCFLFVVSATAQNLRISGGNGHSVVLCEDGGVLAWGRNGRGQLGNDPATGNPYSGSRDEPVQVDMNGNSIQQVDGGSGSHNVALTCNNKVIAWGRNQCGQLGNGDDGGCDGSSPDYNSSDPVFVEAGETGAGDLTDVIYVSGGNDESYAILQNGDVVAWGQNDAGQLGNGNSGAGAYSNTPVYVRDQSGAVLTNVKNVEAGDQTGYALTEDGRVYSWGSDGNGQLGRSAGVAENAGLVTKQDGTALTGIVQLSAGDTHCLAIDEDGNVWSWGGDWGPGQLGSSGGGRNYAARVEGGETGSAYLENVVNISAGQAHSMAVLESGKVVTWGSNRFYNASGGEEPAGQQGEGNESIGSSNDLPSYVLTGAGDTLTNIRGISDGDAWTYAISSDDKIYVWGYNVNGQLGLGASADDAVEYATELPLSSYGCAVPAPCPKVNLGPDSMKTCAPLNVDLSAQTHGGKNLEYRWFRNDTNNTALKTGTDSLYTATQEGDYIVVVEDRRVNKTCNESCPLVMDTVHVSLYVPPATAVDTVGCFSDSIPFKLDGDGEYVWYTQQSGGDSIGSGNPGMLVASDITETNVISNDDTVEYTAYAEDVSSVRGTVFEESEFSFSNPASRSSDQTEGKMRFSADEAFTLNGFTVEYKSGCSGNPNIPVEIIIEDMGGTEVVTTTATLPCPSSDPDSYNLDNLDLDIPQGGDYYLYVLNQDGSAINIPWYQNGPNGWYPVSYTVEGVQLLTIKGDDASYQQWSSPPYWNWDVSTGTQYPCGRLEVTTRKECPPCDTPNVSLTTAPAGNQTTICNGNSVLLEASAHPDHHYTWIRADIGTDNYNDVTSRTIGDRDYEVTNTGLYRAVVDTAGGCADTTDAVEVTVEPVTTPVISNDDTAFCRGSSVEAIASPDPGSDFTWYSSDADGSNMTQVQAAATDDSTYTVTQEGYYRVEIETTSGCKDTSAVQFFNERPSPGAAISRNFSSFCPGTTVQLTADTSDAGFTYKWIRVNGGTNDTVQQGTGQDTYDISTGGDYKVRIIDNFGCDSVSDPLSVTQDTMPNVELAPKPQASFCEGSSVMIEDTWAKSGAGYTYAWFDSTGTQVGGDSPTLTVDDSFYGAPDDQLQKIYLQVTDDGTGCDTISDTISVIRHPVPDPVISDDSTIFCYGTALEAVATPLNGADYTWYSSDAAGNIITGVQPAGTDDSTYQVTQEGYFRVEMVNSEGCSDTSAARFFEVQSAPDPGITTNFSSFCPGTSVNLEAVVSNANFTYQWIDINTASEDTVLTGAGEDSYQIDSGGDYKLRLTDQLGCDSTSAPITVEQDTLPAVEAGDSSAFCQGSSVTIADTTGNTTADYDYQWFNAETGNAISGATSKSYTVDDSNIDSDDTSKYYLQVTDQMTGCVNTSDTIQVITFDKPDAQVTGPAGFCPGNPVTLTGTPNIPNAEYEWFRNGTGAASSISGPATNNNLLEVSQGGDYYVALTKPGNASCADTSDQAFTLTQYNKPNAGIRADSNTFCELNDLTMHADPAQADYSYAWYRVDTDVTPADTIDLGATGESYVTASADNFITIVTNGNGCQDTSAQEVINRVSSVDPEVTVTSDKSGDICFGTDVTFSIDNASNLGPNPQFQWINTNSANPGDPAENMGSSTPLTTADFEYNENNIRLQVVSDEYCVTNNGESVSNAIAINLQNPVVEFVNPDTAYCEGSAGEFLLNIENAGNNPEWDWYRKPGGGTNYTIINGYSESTTLPGSVINDGDSLYVELTPDFSCGGGAVSTKRTERTLGIAVVSYPDPGFTITEDTICMGSTTQLLAGDIQASYSYQWFFEGDNGYDAIDDADTSIYEASREGRYKLEVANHAGDVTCSDTADNAMIWTESLSVNPEASRSSIIQGNTVNLRANATSSLNSPDQLIYNWSPGQSLPDSMSMNTMAQPGEPTSYQLVAQSPNTSCADTGSVYVNVRLPIDVPTAFSPNGDGLNDRWIIEGLSTYPNATIKVYNRWGNVVYQTDDYSKADAWDGTSKNGGELPVATYYWVLNLGVDNMEEMNGPVTIVR